MRYLKIPIQGCRNELDINMNLLLKGYVSFEISKVNRIKSDKQYRKNSSIKENELLLVITEYIILGSFYMNGLRYEFTYMLEDRF